MCCYYPRAGQSNILLILVLFKQVETLGEAKISFVHFWSYRCVFRNFWEQGRFLKIRTRILSSSEIQYSMQILQSRAGRSNILLILVLVKQVETLGEAKISFVHFWSYRCVVRNFWEQGRFLKIRTRILSSSEVQDSMQILQSSSFKNNSLFQKQIILVNMCTKTYNVM